MSDIKIFTTAITKFRDERDWKQFHNPKDLAISLNLEAAEVLEHFQWKSPQEIENHIKANKADIGEELADVLYWVLLLSHDLNIDLADAFEQKMLQNSAKYPVEKAKGSHAKYTRYINSDNEFSATENEPDVA
jgi:NTP pyrophosphatase (non-canonical NTP hydrolase)